MPARVAVARSNPTGGPTACSIVPWMERIPYTPPAIDTRERLEGLLDLPLSDVKPDA